MKCSRLPADNARALLQSRADGILSTHSQALPGYPFGSVVPYCLDLHGLPVILISTIAQHTKNILANNRVSLTITEAQADDVQAASRLTIMANAQAVDTESEEGLLRYYEFFPDSRGYHATHDFDFYSLVPVKLRYVGGFGEIHWLSPEDVVLKSPFSHQEEAAMTQHMNQDHVDAMRHYCDLAGIELEADIDPVMAGIDAEGFHLRLGNRIERFTFDAPVSSSTEVRTALVEMARRELNRPTIQTSG